MTSGPNRGQGLPSRTFAPPTDDQRDLEAARTFRLTCPSCSAEMTSVIDHVVNGAGTGSRAALSWTAETDVVEATLRALRASTSGASLPDVQQPAPGTQSSNRAQHLRLIPTEGSEHSTAPQEEGSDPGSTGSVPSDGPSTPTGAEATSHGADGADGADTADAAAAEVYAATADERSPAVTSGAGGTQATGARRRRQGFFARVLTVRRFRVDRGASREIRDFDAAVAAALEAAVGNGVLSLHHQRLPGRRAAVAHVAIGASGIFVVDARHVTPRTRALSKGADEATDLRLGADLRLADVVATVRAQAAAIRLMLADVELAEVQVTGLVCIDSAGRPTTAGPDVAASDVRVVSLDDLDELVAAAGPLEDDHRRTLHEFLGSHMAPAA